MQRFFLQLAFYGYPFKGWQKQKEAPTVQAAIEEALGTLLRRETEVVGCGRTDAGVHAQKFYAHFDAIDNLPDNFLFKLNGILPPAIAIVNFLPVHREAHARFDASSRSYSYFLHLQKNPFLNWGSFEWHWPELNFEKIDGAVELLRVQKEFKMLSKLNPDLKNSLCDIQNLEWTVTKEGFEINISANRFLRNMVRRIVGCLLQVGRGQLSLEELNDALTTGKSLPINLSVPACGLHLVDIKYPYI